MLIVLAALLGVVGAILWVLGLRRQSYAFLVVDLFVVAVSVPALNAILSWFPTWLLVVVFAALGINLARAISVALFGYGCSPPLFYFVIATTQKVFRSLRVVGQVARQVTRTENRDAHRVN